MTTAYNCNCMDFMKTLPDKAFDLAVVDPPYGDALDTHTHTHGGTDRERMSDSQTERGELQSGGKWNRVNTSTTSVARTGGQWAKTYAKKS